MLAFIEQLLNEPRFGDMSEPRSVPSRTLVSVAIGMVRACCFLLAWSAALLGCVFGVIAWTPGLKGWLRFGADLAPAVSVFLFAAAFAAERFNALGRALSAAFLLSMALCTSLVVPDLLRSTLVWPFHAKTELKTIQFNIQLDDVASNEKLSWIVRERPDFITFQEVKDSRSPIVSALQRGEFPFVYTNIWNNSPGQTVLLSRTKAIDRGFWNERPEVAWATFRYAGRPLTIVSTHVSRGAGSNKTSQAARVTGIVNGLLEHGEVILAGDFNDTPWTPTFRQFESWTALRRRTFDLATWPALAVRLPVGISTAVFPIDHVFASIGWRTQSVRRGPYLGSDHYPVVVTLTR